MPKETKTETITIRTTQEEKEAIERLADNDRRTVGGLVYLWTIERLKKEGC